MNILNYSKAIAAVIVPGVVSSATMYGHHGVWPIVITVALTALAVYAVPNIKK